MLAIASQSSSILPADFYGMSNSKSVTTIFASKKATIAQDILNKKFLLLAYLLLSLQYNVYG